MSGAVDFLTRRPSMAVGVGIFALCCLRALTTVLTPLELGPDEAQYWRWAQTLDWGYYSKPPLIAWSIWAPTTLLGDTEWAARLPSAFGHGLAGLFVFLLGRSLFGLRQGAWAAAIYMMMPGVWLSSSIISTDAVLLPMWAAALFGLDRMRRRPGVAAGIFFGCAVGLAMLAKYAALYILLGAALAAVIDPATRRALLSAGGAAAGLAALLVISPNLAWNAAHDFATVSHTSDNANWGSLSLNPANLGKFVGDQMAVFGPIAFALLVLAPLVYRRPPEQPAGKTAAAWLACFILPPLVIIAVQAVLSRAHANWAASAYPAASVLIASWIALKPWGALIRASVALNAAIGLLLTVLAVFPTLADAIGASSGLKRVRGWEETAVQLEALSRRHDASAIMVDEREVWHGVDYYGRSLELPPLRTWRRLDEPRSHAEEAGALQPGEDRRILIASVRPDFLPIMRGDFMRFESVGALTVPLGGGQERRFALYLAEGYEPKPRSATATD